jgi:hypothetical protein
MNLRTDRVVNQADDLEYSGVLSTPLFKELRDRSMELFVRKDLGNAYEVLGGSRSQNAF